MSTKEAKTALWMTALNRSLVGLTREQLTKMMLNEQRNTHRMIGRAFSVSVILKSVHLTLLQKRPGQQRLRSVAR